jgi:molybdenum-dependent DNA-binding transcriptional regulator ModE
LLRNIQYVIALWQGNLTGSGGTRLTEEGEKAIALFRRFYEDFQKFLERETKDAA